MANSNQEPFAALLKRYRTAALLTQEQLAARAHLSTDAVRGLERGRRRTPRLDSARLLADALMLSGEDREAFLSAAVMSRDTRRADQGGAPNQSVLSGTASPTPLVGREHDLERISQRLRGATGAGNHSGERVRLLTLTGPAGVGKTRLALAAAARLADSFPDGIVWVDLAPVRDPSMVIPTIACALGVTMPPLHERLRDFLRERTTLLVLDNFEQVLPAANVLALLLADCPGLALLVTSRVPLRLRWERQLQVRPLAVPDLSVSLPPPDMLAQIPAVALFLERVRARRDNFVLTESQAPLLAQLVVELDGLPLALELAAARLGTLSLPTIARRLADRLRLLRWAAPDAPERHQSLEAAVGWSYDLLSTEEQRLFRCLGAFVGRVRLDAIAAVAHTVTEPSGASNVDPDAETGRTLEGLLALAEHSLILPAHPTEPAWEQEENSNADDAEDPGFPAFRMLETVRAYAEEQLVAAGELTAAHLEHAHFFLSLAERADPQLRGPDQRMWYVRLERELDNLRAALRWLLDQDDPAGREAGLRLAAALGYFWYIRGHHLEGRRWLEEVLDRAPPGEGENEVNASARTRALLALGVVLRLQGEVAGARAPLDAAAALAERRRDPTDIARIQTSQGLRAVFAGDLEEGTRLLHEARCRWEALGDPWGLGLTLFYLGYAADTAGDETAAARYAAALQQLEVAGDSQLAGLVHSYLGVVLWKHGNLPGAVEHVRAAARTGAVLQDHWLLSFATQAATALMGTRAGPAEQARLLGAADALAQASGATPVWKRLPGGQDISALRERLARGEEATGAAYQEGCKLSFGAVATLTLHLLDEGDAYQDLSVEVHGLNAC